MPLHKPFKNIRLKEYDYRNGCFFVTNSTAGLKHIIIRSKIKAIIEKELKKLEIKFPGIDIDFYNLMPTHIHAILIFYKVKTPLPEVWRQFKAVTTLLAKKSGFLEESLWQRNFYEHVIRNEKALDRIRRYIIANPYKLKVPLNEIYL